MRHAGNWILAGCMICLPAIAVVPASEADRLGKDLTPTGAERAGSADGLIPPWSGRAHFTTRQLDVTRAELESLRRSNPAEATTLLAGRLAAEAPRLVITRASLDQHAAFLTEGHKALFQRYPDYRMPVYGSVRNAFFPDPVVAATRQNAVTAVLDGTDDLRGATLGVPFPVPATGAEVIWNHKLRYRGNMVRLFNQSASVSEAGEAMLSSSIVDIRFVYANPKPSPESGGALVFQALSRTLTPVRQAGQAALVYEPLSGERSVWLYDPARARVLRAPGAGFDTPVAGSAGIQFSDQIDGFNGSLQRYDWKLLGKRAIYMPYNSHRMQSPALKLADVLTRGTLNPAHARYELHRVWVVEATLKPDQRHPIGKRRFYVDEDSWRIAAVDCYDASGQLFRFQESHLATLPFMPAVSGPEVVHDLLSGRYYVSGLVNEGEYSDWSADFRSSHFLPQNLSR